MPFRKLERSTRPRHRGIGKDHRGNGIENHLKLSRKLERTPNQNHRENGNDHLPQAIKEMGNNIQPLSSISLLGLSLIGLSVSIHQSCQYRRYSDISKEPKKTTELTV